MERAPFFSIGALDLFPDNEIREHFLRSITKSDSLATALKRHGLGVKRVDHTHRFLLFYIVATDRVLGEVHDRGGRLREAVLGVGWIVIVRGDHPLLVLEHDTEPRRGRRGGVKAHHLQIGASQRVLELRKEGLPLVVKSIALWRIILLGQERGAGQH